ncbi:MAG: methyltransferase [Sphingomonas sp.]|nr:methyltransferase [Sphingomonas sp.]
MTMIDSAPVTALLDRLFAEDENARPLIASEFAHITDEERRRLMGSKTEYRSFYGHLKDAPLAVSRDTGLLLYMLARAVVADSIVEFGTSFGISTIYLAAALRDNGGGRLITCEFEPEKIARAQAHLTEAGLASLVEFRAGDALETLRSDLPETIDLLLLDGAKALYRDILHLVEPRLRPGALIIADNADYCPEYLEHVRGGGQPYLSVPFGPDVELTMRLD